MQRSGEDLYRLHPDQKSKLIFCLENATEAETNKIQSLLRNWFDTFRRNHNIDTVDTSLFWLEFYKFFITTFKDITTHDGSQLSVTKRNSNYFSKRGEKNVVDKKQMIQKIVSKIDSSTDKEGTLNSELDETSRNSGISCIKDFNFPYQQYTNPAKVAKIANDFLISKMNVKVKTTEQSKPFRAFKRFELTESIVEEAIASLNSVPSSGMLLMTIEMLQLTKKASALILYHIFKRSFDETRIPDDWRHTLVKMKHKDGPREQISNYRPIGITCVPSKVKYILKV